MSSGPMSSGWRGTRIWPISGCDSPWSRRPSLTKPPPTPVPIVRYSSEPTPTPAPQRASASAAPLTSVSIPTGQPKARANGPATSAPFQPGLVVCVTWPQVALPGARSSGPNDAMPIAAGCGRCSRNQPTAAPITTAGLVVSIRWRAEIVPAASEIPSRTLVPPASINPYWSMSRHARRCRGGGQAPCCDPGPAPGASAQHDLRLGGWQQCSLPRAVRCARGTSSHPARGTHHNDRAQSAARKLVASHRRQGPDIQ